MSTTLDSDFYLTVGDRQPAIQAKLLDPSGAPVNLAGASITFSLAPPNASVVRRGGPATVVGSPALGTVIYLWQAADVSVAGVYQGEWIVTFADATQMTFPSDTPIRIKIRQRV